MKSSCSICRYNFSKVKTQKDYILHKRTTLQTFEKVASWWRRPYPQSAGVQPTAHCNTLQHTATHRNTLQYPATHHNTLQHTATHRNTLQHTATHCNTLQHTAKHCKTPQSTAKYNTLQHTATHCNTLKHTATHKRWSAGKAYCIWSVKMTLYKCLHIFPKL